MECGKVGHLKCTKEKASNKIPIDTIVKDDLDEFIDRFAERAKLKKVVGVSYVNGESDSDLEKRDSRFSFDYIEEIKGELEEEVVEVKSPSKSWLKSNTNLKVPESTYSSVYRGAQKKYGLPKNHTPKEIYCCLCGGTHSDDSCSLKANIYGNQRFQ